MTIRIGYRDPDSLITYPEVDFLSRCAQPIQNMPVREARVVPKHGGSGLEASQSMLRWRGVHSSFARSSSASAADSISSRVGHEAAPGMVEARAPAQFARRMHRSMVCPCARAAANTP